MGLSSDLISQFVKATNDRTETKKESTHYGTVVEYNGSKYVRLDGSDLLTPVDSTVSIIDGDRAMVIIKDHTATVTGNLSDPAASNTTVTQIGSKVSEFEIIVADKVSTKVLEAEIARIDSLTADNVVIKDTLTANRAEIDELIAEDVVINGILTAAEADIEKLNANKLDVNVANITYATITDLNATNANIYNLEATYGDFEILTTNKFTAVDGIIDNLQTTKLDAETARITYATITDLNAARADIGILDADVADINTLIFGAASGSSIQTSFANAVIAQLGNAQIKSAMIENVNASKITAGDIITDKVRVMSEDGKLLISDETIQISDNTRVRVQIGKDSSGDYSINIWDADGKLMFSEGGITDNAIKEAIIRNDMVSDDANISAHKLDINSLFDVVNEDGSHTIKSSKIYLSDEKQTLDMAFEQMTTSVNGIQSTVQSQGTALGVVQGQISSKIWEQDITTAVDNIEIGGRNLLRNSNFTNGIKYWTSVNTTINVVSDETFGKALSVISANPGSSNYRMYHDTNAFTHKYGTTYTLTFWAKASSNTTITTNVDSQYDGKTYSLTTSWQKFYHIYTADSSGSITFWPNVANITIYLANIKLELGNKATDWTPAPEDTEADISTLSTQYSTLEQTVNGITATVASHSTEIAKKADGTTVTEVQEKVAILEQNVDGFQSMVTKNYATKTEVNNVSTTANAALDNTKLQSDVTNYAQLNDDTASMWGFTADSTADGHWYTMNNISRDKFISGFHVCEGGEKFRISFEISTSCKGNTTNGGTDSTYRGTTIGLYSYDAAGGNSSIKYASRVTATADAPATSVTTEVTLGSNARKFKVFVQTESWGNFSGTIKIRKVRVEKIDKELDSRVTTNESKITQNANNITAAVSRITNNETDITSLQLTADGLTSRVSSTESNVETALTNAANAQADIDGLSIGGRNILENSSFASDATKWSGTTTAIEFVEKDGKRCAHINHPSAKNTITATQDLMGDLEPETYYTMSGWVMTENIVKGTTNYTIMFYHDGYYNNNGTSTWYGYGSKAFPVNTSTGTWYYLTWTFKTDTTKFANATSSNMYVFTRDFTGDVYFCNLKLEKGNRATDWTPAPEDLATGNMIDEVNGQIDNTNARVNDAETLIQQLSDCISMLVTDSNGESMMTQTSTGWTFSMKETNDAMSSLSNSIEDLQSSTGSTQATINGLQNAINDLETTAQYVRVTPYQNEPCIELGKSDSEFKLMITNTRIMFMRGSSIPTYIDTTGLITENITINGELTHGSFVWKQRSNGNYGIQYIG